MFEFLKENLNYSKSELKEKVNPDDMYWYGHDFNNKVWIGSGDDRDPNTIYADDLPLDSSKYYNVNVRFVVEKDGSLSNISACDCLLNEEAIRVVKKMPKWKPATIRDTVVRSKFFLPVLFKIDENEDK